MSDLMRPSLSVNDRAPEQSYSTVEGGVAQSDAQGAPVGGSLAQMCSPEWTMDRAPPRAENRRVFETQEVRS
ncbi:hypothetical protein GCM10027026_08690 [Myroides odoratimimus subsp. xuanwuensis]